MSGQLGVGGACLTVAAVGLVWLARLWPARPARGGRHRGPVAAIEAGPAPVEALVIRETRCPVRHADTEHVAFALGGLMCRKCPPRGSS